MSLQKIYNAIQLYDCEALKKLNENRNKQFLNKHKKYIQAREKGDEVAIKKAMYECSKHKQEDANIREMVSSIGFFWM